jgi:hypothetical protein
MAGFFLCGSAAPVLEAEIAYEQLIPHKDLGAFTPVLEAGIAYNVM